MLAILGAFPFEINSAPYDKLERVTQQRWTSNNRIGQRAAMQHLGPGDDSITLSGTLVPEISGGRLSLDLLRIMADEGQAWPFIDGEGFIYGLWVIESVKETRQFMFDDGAPRQIDFVIKIKRADSTQVEKIGVLTRVGLNLL